jgi:3',5'-cyclic AMP phosphodiesterase CpdA
MLGRMLVIGHISDTHFDLRSRSVSRARRVMAYLRSVRLDVIVVTGDVADHGAPGEYEEAVAELTAEVPVLALPGNHDERSAFRLALLGQDGAGPINRAAWVGDTLFALCDSTIPGHNQGELAPETLAWLDEVLTDADAPSVICLHHPPVPVHNPLLDEIRLTNAAALAELIEQCPHVVAVLCGHAHMAAASTFAGRPVLVAPAVISTLRLPWTTTEELTWQNVVDFDRPPEVAFHVLDEAGRITTHYRVVPP